MNNQNINKYTNNFSIFFNYMYLQKSSYDLSQKILIQKKKNQIYQKKLTNLLEIKIIWKQYCLLKFRDNNSKII